MSKEKLTLKEKIVEGIDNFFRRRLIFLWIFLCVVILCIIGIFIWNEIDRNIKQTSAQLSEEAQDTYTDWISESDENKKTRIEEELLENLAQIIKQYPNQYATQRALSIRASLYAEKSEWENAARDYRDLAESFPKSFYSPISYINAAVCYEELNDLDSALAMLKKVVESYKNSYDVPYALYMMGRLSEKRGKNSEAEEYYTQITKDEYSYSNWSKLAQNRIIYLKIEGQQQ
ncbi:MAG: tetratricopeptide repeat protein [Spirochaetales bacterium]|nr:tetratricopeptide repeat protein [Spirochaetales bacterium]